MPTPAPVLKPAAELLLTTAERLFAEKGLGAVSTREIAREAGQRNNSALSYHFGSTEGLIEAILDFRMGALNTKRQHLLDALIAQNQLDDVHALLHAVVTPLAEELLRPVEDSYYLSLLSQLLAQRGLDALRAGSPARSRALDAIGQHLLVQMQTRMPAELAIERLELFGLQLVHTIADWDRQRRSGTLLITPATLERRSRVFLDYLAGALNAPTSPE